MQIFVNWEDVPLFDSEGSEAVFWAENRPALRLSEEAVRAIETHPWPGNIRELETASSAP